MTGTVSVRPRLVSRLPSLPDPATASPAMVLVERALFAGLLFGLGVRGSLPRGDMIVLGLCLLVTPLWVGSLVATRWGKIITGLGVAALVSGLTLSNINASTHVVNSRLTLAGAVTVGLLVAATGVVAHATSIMSVRAVGLCLGLGLLADGVVNPGTLGAMNPLKFAVLGPAAVIVFSLVYGRSALLQLAALLVMAAVGILAEARAFFGTAIVAALIVLWQIVRSRRPQRFWAVTAAFIVGMVLAVYNLATTLLISGYLGSYVQQRSLEQVETSGSILLGGRPELSATVALIRHDVTGFGFGVVANGADIAVAKTGMASINYDPDNGYVDRFMFGSAVELHSVVGDLWAACGPVGLILVVVLFAFAFVNVARLASARQNDVLLVFYSVWMLWNLLFSPLPSAVTVLFLTIGLLANSGERSMPGGPPLRRRRMPGPAPAVPA